MTNSTMNFSTIEDVKAFAHAKSACPEAMRWLATQIDPATAWETCKRPDWMIWLAARRGVDRKTIVRVACACARTSLRFVPEGEDRPRLAIETAERWCDDRATIEEVRAAAYAAAYAAAAAYADADDAAYAAAYAAAAAYADDADADDADAAYAAAYAAADAAAYADADARRQANIQMCQIVREHISFEMIRSRRARTITPRIDKDASQL